MCNRPRAAAPAPAPVKQEVQKAAGVKSKEISRLLVCDNFPSSSMAQRVTNEAFVTIIEEREEEMVSCDTGGSPTVRLARFLKPTVSSLSSGLPSRPPVSKTKASPLTVHFNGWKSTPKKWKEWVDQLRPKYGAAWKKAGIYNSIIVSTYEYRKDTALVLGLAECWCPDTNTFVFSWGEATLTLEDMFVLGGFSILGEPVTSPLTGDLVQIEERMIQEYKGLSRTAARKVQHCSWIKRFTGSNGDLEHAAFLSLWLSRFVFPTKPDGTISKQVFPVAIHLSQDTQIALAPAVLASLYRDLRVLKERLDISSTKVLTDRDSSAIIYAPFQIMQLWAWERFPSLQPTPNCLSPGQPRAARWHKLTSKLELNVVRTTISLPDEYKWQPYSSILEHQENPLYGQEQGKWVTVGPKMVGELLAIYRCFVPCELVGLCCIEQYVPHRVGRQFGMDQDIPGTFTRANANWKIAWRTYDRPITDIQLYIPPHHHSKSCVTAKYLDWWNQSTPGSTNAHKRSSSSCWVSIESSESSSSNSPPRYACKRRRQEQSLKDDDRMTISEWCNSQRANITNSPPRYACKRRRQEQSLKDDDRMTISEWCNSQRANITLDNVADSSCKKLARSSTQGSSSDRKKLITKAPGYIFVEDNSSSKHLTCNLSKMFNPAGSVPPGFETEARIRRLETAIDMLKKKFSSLKLKRQSVGSASHA